MAVNPKAYRINRCNRLELSKLIKSGCIKKGRIVSGDISWNQQSNNEICMAFISRYTDTEKSITFSYYTRELKSGKKRKHCFKIELIAKPSNLGKGEILYMLCPSNNGKLCRILYLVGNSERWYSRQYYKEQGIRLYYPSQALSKNDLAFNQRLKFEREIKLVSYKKKFHSHYKGEETKAFMQLKSKYAKLRFWEDRVSTILTQFVDS